MGAGFGSWLVIDGQQRVTTLTLLMVALRDYLAEVGWTGSTPNFAQMDDYVLKNNFGTGARRYGVALRRICLVVAALVMLAALSGCSGASPAEVPPSTPTAGPVPAIATKTVSPAPTELRSGKVRSAPTVGAADLAELVRGNNAFAFDLYRALSGREGNLFIRHSAFPRPSP